MSRIVRCNRCKHLAELVEVDGVNVVGCECVSVDTDGIWIKGSGNVYSELRDYEKDLIRRYTNGT